MEVDDWAKSIIEATASRERQLRQQLTEAEEDAIQVGVLRQDLSNWEYDYDCEASAAEESANAYEESASELRSEQQLVRALQAQLAEQNGRQPAAARGIPAPSGVAPMPCTTQGRSGYTVVDQLPKATANLL